MVCDTLSGRSPLYKVEGFIAEGNYRAIVIQTDQLDKRTTKAIERKRLKEKVLTQKTICHCPLAAAKALETLTRKNKNSHWHIITH